MAKRASKRSSVETSRSQVRRLYLFDFDGTLFRSPEPPPNFKGVWWESEVSLTPPIVPHVPGEGYWHLPTLEAAREALRDPDGYVVFATGRITSLQGRVEEILTTQGLDFDEVLLNPRGSGTSAFKRGELRRLLNTFPFAISLVIWEDRPDYLEGYQRLGERFGVVVEPHLVGDLAMTPSTRRKLVSKVVARYIAAGRRPKKRKSKGKKKIKLNPAEMVVWETQPQGGKKKVKNPETGNDIQVKNLLDPGKGRKNPMKERGQKQFQDKWERLDPEKKIQLLKQTLGKVATSRIAKGNPKTKAMIRREIEKLEGSLEKGGGKAKAKEEKGKGKAKAGGGEAKKKLKGLLGKLKIKAKGMAEGLKKGGEALAKFVTDEKSRNEALKKAANALDKATPILVKELVKNFINEAAGYGGFVRNVKGIRDGSINLRVEDPDNPGQKILNRDVMASLYGTGAYVAAAVAAVVSAGAIVATGGGAAALGGLAATTAVGFTKSKMMHSILRTTGNAVSDYAQGKAHEDLKKEYKAAPEGEEKEKLKEEYEESKSRRKEADKLERILGAGDLSEGEFNKLKKDLGNDSKYGEFLQSKEAFAAMPENRRVKAENDLADLKKRAGREVLDRVFLGAEWLEVFSGVGATLGMTKDWFKTATGGMGTDWLGTAAGAIGSSLKSVVTGSEGRRSHRLRYSPSYERAHFDYKILRASDDAGTKAVEEFVTKMIRSLSADMRKGISESEMKSILEFDMESFESGEAGEKVSKLLGKTSDKDDNDGDESKGSKKTAACIPNWSGNTKDDAYYSSFSW